MAKKFLLLIFLFIIFHAISAQEAKVFFLYENSYTENAKVYQDTNFLHSALKPLLFSEFNSPIEDTLLYSEHKNSTVNLILNKDLFFKKNKNVEITINPIFSSIAGYELQVKKMTSQIETGLAFQANFSKKLSFNANYSFNSISLASFYKSDASDNLLIPHYGKAFETHGDVSYYHNIDARLSYSPNQYFNLQTGYGKNFIGDGYRSLFLSENANAYPFFRATASFWKLKYQLIHAALKHVNGFEQDFSLQKKWSVMHYISLNLGKRLNLGFFETINANPKDSVGERGFEINYLNPIVFFRPVEYTIGSPDNAILGFSGKLRLFENLHLYSQIVLDEFNFSEVKKKNGYWANKFGLQAGFKAFDAFKIKGLFLQSELNTVRPYTYSHAFPVTNHAHYYEPLAHPYGANFYELLAIANYSFSQRMQINLKLIYTLIGLDEDINKSVGQDVFRSYTLRQMENGNTIAQGIETQIFYNQLGISYLINPKWQTLAFVEYSNIVYKNNIENKNIHYLRLGIKTTIFAKENTNISL